MSSSTFVAELLQFYLRIFAEQLNASLFKNVALFRVLLKKNLGEQFQDKANETSYETKGV